MLQSEVQEIWFRMEPLLGSNHGSSGLQWDERKHLGRAITQRAEIQSWGQYKVTCMKCLSEFLEQVFCVLKPVEEKILGYREFMILNGNNNIFLANPKALPVSPNINKTVGKKLLKCYVTVYYNFCIIFSILNTNDLILQHLINKLIRGYVCVQKTNLSNMNYVFFYVALNI